MFPANAASTGAAPHPNYASHNAAAAAHAAAASKSAYNHAADEAAAKFGQPVGYTRPVGQPATFTRFSKPVSAAPAAAEGADTRPSAANVAAYGARQPPANAARGYPPSVAPAQYSHGAAAATTSAQYAQPPDSSPANPTYPAYGAGAAYGGPANAAPVYQNVALGQTAQATAAGPPYVNRSRLQSPPNGGRPNANSTTNAQMLPPAGKQYAAPHGYGYPPAGQEREQYASQAVAGQQHGASNRSYEMNGHQAGPVGHQGQGYGSQYSSVPPQMSNRYPGVSVRLR